MSEITARVIPKYDARAFVNRLREQDVRIIRVKDGSSVFVITANAKLAEMLVQLGGRFPAGGSRGFKRGKHTVWDVWIHPIPVAGELTIWEAARLAEEGG